MSSNVQNKSPWQAAWAAIVPFVAPPAAAACAIVPLFYGFIAKSAQQLGNPIPRMRPVEVLKASFQAAPTIGCIVGTQMVAQSVIEKAWMRGAHNQAPSFISMFVSSALVGAASAPALAIFNGQTLRQSPMQSLRSLSFKQSGAIVCRETSFLLGLRISGPVEEAMKRRFGDNQAVGCGAAFFSGLCSIVGHPADSAFTLWQKGRKVHTFSQLMRGAPIRAVTVGGFSVGYKIIKEGIESSAN